MKLIRLVARPLEGAMFVYGGYDALRNPESKVPRAEKVAPKVANAFGFDVDTETLVRFNGAVQIGAGVALAFGVLPRLAAIALAASLVPTTLAGHRFWEEDDPRARSQQMLQFLKNAAMLGGLLMIVAEDR